MEKIYLARLSPALTGKEASAAQHRAGEALLRLGLEREFGLRDCRVLRQEHGKPWLPDHPGAFFSVSHCAGLAACAFGSRDLGLDAEDLRPFPRRVASRVLSPGEQEQLERAGDRDECFFRFWTLKESFAKLDGRGLALPFEKLGFTLLPEGCVCEVPGYSFSQVRWEGFVLSLCVRGGGEGGFRRARLLPEHMILLEEAEL